MNNRKIKKLAKKFWREWGVSKEDFEIIAGTLSLFIIIYAFYIFGCMF